MTLSLSLYVNIYLCLSIHFILHPNIYMNIYIISTSPSLSVALKVCPCGPKACGVFNLIFTYFYQTILHMFVSFASLFYSPLLCLSTLTFLSRMHLLNSCEAFVFHEASAAVREIAEWWSMAKQCCEALKPSSVVALKCTNPIGSPEIIWNISTLAHPVLDRDVPLTRCHSQLGILSWFQGLEAELSFSAVAATCQTFTYWLQKTKRFSHWHHYPKEKTWMFSGVISNQSSVFLRSFLRFGAAGIVTKKGLWQTLQALQHWRVLYHGVIQHTISSWKTLRLWRGKNPTRMCFKSNALYNHV